MKPHCFPALRRILSVCLLAIAFCASAAERPNIVVILVDDMGFSDIGCYGGEMSTPNIDRLAKDGLRFTQFYNTGRCCPTRASLLTGLYSHQAGIGQMVDDKKLPGYRGFLNDRCVTLGEALHAAGYFTAVSGKWHVGHSDESMWPLQRGFDRFYGTTEGGGFYFKVKAGRTIREGNELLYSQDKQPPAGWYTTDAWTDNGIKFVNEALDEKKPFFLYLAHNAPHFPLQAPEAEVAKYRGKFKAGWDKLRAERYERMVRLGIVESTWALSPRPDNIKPWDKLTAEEQDRFDNMMAVYAAVIEKLDSNIGRLVDALKKRDALDNTLILFLSDNGGTAEGGPNGRSNGPGAMGSADSDVYYGPGWATLSNTPYRRYKIQNHEGGISTPLIAHWPAQIKDKGALRHQVGHVIDLMPTCLEVAGAKYPTEFKGKPIQPMEGKSLLPAFKNQPLERTALYWEHFGNAAVRAGDWKLVRFGKNGPWELYDLRIDRTELKDLATENPAKAKELTAIWEAWALRANVKPAPGEGGGKKKK